MYLNMVGRVGQTETKSPVLQQVSAIPKISAALTGNLTALNPESQGDLTGTKLVVGIVGTAIGLLVGGAGVLFHFGVAKESPSKLVRTTGYVMAGAGALGALVSVAGLAFAIAGASEVANKTGA